MFTAALFTIAMMWKHLKLHWKCVICIQWNAIQPLKKEGIIQNVATCMNLEDIKLNQISQSPKDKYCMIPLYETSKIVKVIEAESSMVLGRGWWRGNKEIFIQGYKVSVMQDE